MIPELPSRSTDLRSAGSRAPVVVLVSAPWAGPSRPAPTVLHELGRRWGAAVQVLLIDDPSEQILETLRVEVLPTWMGFRIDLDETGSPMPGPSTPETLLVPELTGTAADGEERTLRGPWRLVHRRTGAQPKHVIDEEFGPHSAP